MEKLQPYENTCLVAQEEYKLTLFNDSMHSFDFVIGSLVEVCQLGYLQAETCTMIAHRKGKCVVKHGSYNSLLSMHQQLVEKRLTAAIS